MILIGIVVAALIQIASAPEQSSPEIVADEPQGENQDTPQDGGSTTAPPEPFIYRVGVLASISTDNFWAFYGEQPSVWNSYILGPTKPALMSIDPVSNALTNELIADAAKPSKGADGWHVDMTLREDFAWSDGRPVSAHDVAYTFDVVRSLEMGGSWADAFPEQVDSIKAKGDHALTIEFSSRPHLAVWPHAVGLAPIMPSHVWQKTTNDATARQLYAADGSDDVGGGLLELASFNDALVISNRNPGYPQSGGADTVEYHVYPNEQALASALTDGEIDSVLTPKGLATEHVTEVSTDPAVTVLANTGNGVRYLGFNLTREPMATKEFRTAVALLVDRAQVAEALPAIADPAFSFVGEANAAWFDADRAEEIAALYGGDLGERLDTAVEGLEDAGYAWDTRPAIRDDGTVAPGTGLEIDGRSPQPLTILTPGDAYDSARPDYVSHIAETISLLGFDVRPVETDFDTVVDLAFTPDDDGTLHYDMYLLGWTLGSPAFPDYYRPLFARKGQLNNTGYSSKAFKDLLTTYETSHTIEEARTALWDMEMKLATDLPYLVLYHSQITEAYRSDRVSFDVTASLGGIQARLGGIGDVSPFN